MDRKKFLKNSLLGTVGAIDSTKISALNVRPKNSDYDKMLEQIGFNHLPNKEIMTMKSVLHKANTRGHADHGWLKTYHTFSFANYHNPERMHFGVLRVLNDDSVMAGRGFATHSHDNMEIISIPLEGDLEHKDSMGNTTVIKQGDIQIMSAGTGIMHSEYNKNTDKDVKFLQIWMFPNKRNVTPRYDQITLNENHNTLQQILSPSAEDAGVWSHQNAWFHLGTFDADATFTYTLNDNSNGVYCFIIQGEFTINTQTLQNRDGFGIWDIESLELTSKMAHSKILIMEVPMELS